MFNDLNSVSVSGHVANVDVRYLPDGTRIIEFSLAIRESRKRDDEWEDYTNWLTVVKFGGGEKLTDYVKKGARVGVEGRLRQNRWETEDGQKRSRVVLRAFNIHILKSVDEEELVDEEVPF